MSAADDYARADAALRSLTDVRRALCAADNALDELGAHGDDVAIVRKARDAVGYAALDAVDLLILRETARRDAAELAARGGEPDEAAA